MVDSANESINVLWFLPAHGDERYPVAELLLTLLPLAHGQQQRARSVNTGPVSETMGGDKRPPKPASAS
jgi:alkanesulfonate monooxygenase